MGPWFWLLVAHGAAADPDGAFPGSVVVQQIPDGSLAVVPLDSVLPKAQPEDDGAPKGWTVDSMEIRVVPGTPTAVEIDARITAHEPGWVEPQLRLMGGLITKVTLDGRQVERTELSADGTIAMPMKLKGRHRLRIVGTVETPTSTATLNWTSAPEPVRTTLEVVGKDLDVSVHRDAVPLGPQSFDVPGFSQVGFSWKPKAAPTPKPQVRTCETASAFRIDETGLEGKARLRWTILNQPAASLSFQIPGGVSDVKVEGPSVASYRQSGDTVTVELFKEIEGTVDMQVSFRNATTGTSARTMPIVLPATTGNGAHQGWVTLLRGDADAVVPDRGRDLEVVSSREQPRWASGMMDGSPVSRWRVSGPRPQLQATALTYTPVDTPPTLVDEAVYEVSYTADGGVAMQARYQVQNDRSQYLKVTLPLGWRLLGARVTGEVVQPVRTTDEEGRTVILVPLEKSIETLTGLVRFPVDLALWGREGAWDPSGQRPIVTPALDAPIAYAKWTMHLPMEVKSKKLDSRAEVVEAWADGRQAIAMGYALERREQAIAMDLPDDDAGSDGEDYRYDSPARRNRGLRLPSFGAKKTPAKAPASKADEASQDTLNTYEAEKKKKQQVAQAEALENEAWRAYQSNEFDKAEELLQQSSSISGGSSRSSALMSNISSLKSSNSGGESSQSRRVRELAWARAQDKETEQATLVEKAKGSMRAGNYAEAEAQLAQALELTEELAMLEQQESVEQKNLLKELEGQYAETQGKLGKASGSKGKLKADKDAQSDPNTGVIEGRVEKPEVAIIPDRFVQLIVEEPEEPELLDEEEEVDEEPMVAFGRDRPREERGEAERKPAASPAPPPPPPPVAASPATTIDFATSAASGDMAYEDFPAQAGAPKPRDSRRADQDGRYKSETSIDFEGVEITGELVKPQGALLLDRKRANYNSSISTPDITDNIGRDAGQISGGYGGDDLDGDGAFWDAEPEPEPVMIYNQLDGRPSNDAAPGGSGPIYAQQQIRISEEDAGRLQAAFGTLSTEDSLSALGYLSDETILAGEHSLNGLGTGGLGARGSGIGGGGNAEGLGGLGTMGRGSGASGYGAGVPMSGSTGSSNTYQPDTGVDAWGDAAFEGEGLDELGYVEGGVEGGVVGGVLGGVMGGSAGHSMNGEAVQTESTTRSSVVTRDFMERVPAGRSYGSSVMLTVEGIAVSDDEVFDSPELELSPQLVGGRFPRRVGTKDAPDTIPGPNSDNTRPGWWMGADQGWPGPSDLPALPPPGGVDATSWSQLGTWHRLHLSALGSGQPYDLVASVRAWEPTPQPTFLPRSQWAEAFPVGPFDADPMALDVGDWPDPERASAQAHPDPLRAAVQDRADPLRGPVLDRADPELPFAGLPGPPPRAPQPDAERPPPGPAADQPIGLLDVPKAVDGAQLTLNPPVTGGRVLLEQRLVPPNTPLKVALTYKRARRTPDQELP